MLSETQFLTIALATVPTLLVVAIGILLNNHRLGDMKERLNDLKETLRAEIKAGDSAILSQMAQYQMDIQNRGA
jgi:uncharacterized membrane protein (DUF106 family)